MCELRQNTCWSDKTGPFSLQHHLTDWKFRFPHTETCCVERETCPYCRNLFPVFPYKYLTIKTSYRSVVWCGISKILRFLREQLEQRELKESGGYRLRLTEQMLLQNLKLPAAELKGSGASFIKQCAGQNHMQTKCGAVKMLLSYPIIILSPVTK